MVTSRPYPEVLEDIRATEFPQLTRTTYLDHAGTTLYAQSLVDRYAADLKTNLFGNPHSASESSKLSSDRVAMIRSMVLDYFKADPRYFDVVFTANTTAAIKLVAQAFQNHNFWYGYHKDAHTSLVGVRELANAGSQCFSSDAEVDAWINHNATLKPGDYCKVKRLIAWPAQSNMTGYRPPLSWASKIREAQKDMDTTQTYTLLDAASYLTTGSLDLSDSQSAPDFIGLSFYKIFGFPDLGALIVRKEAGDILRTRSYFGGGTVDMVIAMKMRWHALHRNAPLHEVLEDGTIAFHSIVALQHAITVHRQLYGSPVRVSEYVSALSAYAYRCLAEMKHFNGRSVIHIYKDPGAHFGDSRSQGPIIAFNLKDSQGHWIGKSRFERLAIACNIQVRTGGVCNPGGIASMLQLEAWELRRNYSVGMTCGDQFDVLGKKPTGVVRASFGAMTSLGDVQALVLFIQTFFVEHQPTVEKTRLDTCNSPYPDPTVQTNSLSSSTITVVEPIVGLPSITMNADLENGSPHALPSYSFWDKEWVLVDPHTRQLVDVKGQPQGENVQIQLDPQSGLMSISVRPVSHCLAGGEVEKYETKITINMWEVPNHQPEQTWTKPEHHRHTSDSTSSDSTISTTTTIYTDPEIQQFFSDIAGRPCTLERNTSRHLNRLVEESLRCVVAGCKSTFADNDEVDAHYVRHAEQFRKKKEEEEQKLLLSNSNAPPHLMIVPSKFGEIQSSSSSAGAFLQGDDEEEEQSNSGCWNKTTMYQTVRRLISRVRTGGRRKRVKSRSSRERKRGRDWETVDSR